MKGHEPLIAMRRRGAVPSVAMVMFDADLSRRDWPAVDPRVAWVHIEPHDKPARLDLRCFVGVPVVVIGYPENPVKAATAALVKAGAKRVGASIFERGPAETVREIERFEGGQWHTC